MEPIAAGQPESEALPDPNWLAAIVGALASELEPEFPGLIERINARIDDAKLRENVIRIRGHGQHCAMQGEVRKALRWLDLLAVSVALRRPGKRRKR